ncbi:MAG: hypothetical protein IJ568_00145 [Bacilli bacterium]|nr:hypothetical protein [Bacilli bacterium]
MKKLSLIMILVTILLFFSTIKVEAKVVGVKHKFDNTVITYRDSDSSGGGSVSCEGLLTSEGIAFIHKILNYFRILGPIAFLLFIGLDFAQGILAQDDSILKKATSKIVSRAIGLVLLILVPTIVGVILDLPGVRDAIEIPNDPLCGTMASFPDENNYIIE